MLETAHLGTWLVVLFVFSDVLAVLGVVVDKRAKAKTNPNTRLQTIAISLWAAALLVFIAVLVGVFFVILI